MGDKITQLPSATTVDGTEIVPIVQGGATKQVLGSIIRRPFGVAAGDLAGTYPSPTLASITTAQNSVGSTSDIPVLSIDSKGRVTGLSTAANTMGTVTSVNAGTGLTGGPITSTGTLSVVYGTTAGTAAQGNDSRFSTIPTASTTPPSPDSSSPVIGTSTNFARADHSHPKAVTTLSGDVVGSGAETISAQLATITSSQSNVGSATQVPQISIDSKGRVTALSSVPLPQNSITNLTGDVVANGPGSVAATLSASGVTAGSYGYAATGKIPTITVDSKGRVTGASESVITNTSDKESNTFNSFALGTKTFNFTVNSGVAPYIPGQYITAIDPSSTRWVSGNVISCTAAQVTVFCVTGTGIGGNSSSWRIRPGFSLFININGYASGKVLGFDGSGLLVPVDAGGGGSGNATSLQGTPVSSTAPSADQVLKFDGTNWIPATSTSSSNATQLQGFDIAETTPTAGYVLTWDGINSEWAPAEFSQNSNATQIQGVDVSATAPADGEVLLYNATAQEYQPAAIPASADATQLQGTDILAGIVPTENQVLTWGLKDPIAPGLGYAWKPIDPVTDATALQTTPVSTAAPSVGNFLKLVTGGDSVNRWTPSSDVSATQLQGYALDLANNAPTSGTVLGYIVDGSGSRWQPVTPISNATAIQSVAISSTYPNTAEALVYNGTNWIPTAVVNIASYSGSPNNQSAPVGWIQIVLPGSSTPTFIPIYQ